MGGLWSVEVAGSAEQKAESQNNHADWDRAQGLIRVNTELYH